MIRADQARTGIPQWEDPSTVGAFLNVAAHAGLVFAAGELEEARQIGGSLVRAYEAETGTALWEHARRGEVSWAGAIEVSGARVIVADSYFGCVNALDSFLRACDSFSGAPLWEYADAFTF